MLSDASSDDEKENHPVFQNRNKEWISVKNEIKNDPLLRDIYIIATCLMHVNWIEREVVDDIVRTLERYNLIDQEKYKWNADFAIEKFEENNMIEYEKHRIRMRHDFKFISILNSTIEESYFYWGCKIITMSIAWDYFIIRSPFSWEDIEFAEDIAKNKIHGMDEMNKITKNSLEAGLHIISILLSMKLKILKSYSIN